MNDTDAYLEKISDSISASKLPGEDPTEYIGENFDMHVST